MRFRVRTRKLSPSFSTDPLMFRPDVWNNDSDVPTDSESEFMMLSP